MSSSESMPPGPRNVFILESRRRQWLEAPQGTYYQFEEGFIVEDEASLEDWLKPFIQREGDVQFVDDSDPKVLDAAQQEESPSLGGWPYVVEEWDTFGAFLTDAAAQSFADDYGWEDGYRIQTVPCDVALRMALGRAIAAREGVPDANP